MLEDTDSQSGTPLTKYTGKAASDLSFVRLERQLNSCALLDLAPHHAQIM